MYFDSLQGWLNWQELLHPRAIDMGLGRVSQVYHALNPDAIRPLTITVAGTNGKGSSVAFLEAIYRAQGYRVGAYTSPHILKYNERIKIDAQLVSDAVICAAFERIEAVRNETSLSYFEFGTLAALEIFRQADLDIQLLEVGLGGRLDAVNIIDADIALITSICIDHSEWLGATREAIGSEKAGIFRCGIDAVIGDPDPPQSLLQCAAEQSTPIWCFGQEFGYQKQSEGWQWFAPGIELRNLPDPLLKGEHQYRNASAVLAAVTQMNSKLPVSEKAISTGIKQASLLGRFQWVPDRIPVLLDVAHNPQAVRSLLDYLATEFPNKRKHAVFSMMRDKDISSVVDIMKPVIDNWFISPLKNPRTAPESIMREIFNNCAVEKVSFGFTDFSETLAAAKNSAEKNDLILVFGSFFLVSEFLAERQ
jgi:dihydrofolate synthase/folylpolyglutamate synthase